MSLFLLVQYTFGPSIALLRFWVRPIPKFSKGKRNDNDRIFMGFSEYDAISRQFDFTCWHLNRCAGIADKANERFNAHGVQQKRKRVSPFFAVVIYVV